MRVRSGAFAGTVAAIARAVRPGNFVSYGVHETRRWARFSRRDSCGLLHDGGATERDDRFLPRNWSVGGKSPREQCRGRRAVSRRQCAAARQAEVRSEGFAEPGENGHVSFRIHDGRSHHEMKTWIPDVRNFAYLNWKQVDALPRETTLLVLPTAAIEQHGHHLPLATDTLINTLLLGKHLALAPRGAAIYAPRR